MARPTKWRKIEHMPAVPYFIPSELSQKDLPEIVLLTEELEAIRLKDLLGMEQEECAQKMEVSRPTFQRILISAREKVADCLINGKVIHVEGGNFTRNICPVRCEDCGKEWSESFENMESIRKGEYVCPACGSNNITCIQTCSEKFCRKNCRRHGHGRHGDH